MFSFCIGPYLVVSSCLHWFSVSSCAYMIAMISLVMDLECCGCLYGYPFKEFLFYSFGIVVVPLSIGGAGMQAPSAQPFSHL